METRLLTDNEITKNTPIGGNVDVDRIRLALQDAQTAGLMEILGENLYEKICSELQSLSGDYLELYTKYIKPYLWHRAAMEYLLVGAYQIANGGVFRLTPQNGTPAEKNDVDALAQSQRTKSEIWQQRMERYLEKKQLPEYASTSDAIVNPSYKTNVGGWYFGQ